MVYDGSIASILRCLLTGNANPSYGFGPAIYTNSSETRVEKCEIVNNNDYGIHNASAIGGRFVNNIVVNNTIAGVNFASGGAFLDYNDVWNNWIDYAGIIPGATDSSIDPVFFWYPDPWSKLDNYDFHFEDGSPCINAGNPMAAFNDPNGSRNDIGVYGGAAAKVYCLNVITRPATPVGVPLNPAYTACHNLSGAVINVNVEIEIVNAGGVVYNTVTPYALVFTSFLPFPGIPGLPAGNYYGKATMVDIATMTVTGEDIFSFNVF
jgi:hypothetical protein